MQLTSKRILIAFLVQLLIIKHQFVSIWANRTESYNDVTYDYHNVMNWGNNYPVCDGSMQSPIDIDLEKIEIGNKSCKFRFKDYQKSPKCVTLKNNGHTVKVIFEWFDFAPFVIHNRKKYIFNNLHFHWGRNNYEGSEHTFMNKSFPLEMHMVHYKQKFETAEEDEQDKDGFLVIGVVFKITKEKVSNISPLAEGISVMKNENSIAKVKPFKLSNFNPEPRNGFINYLGSLTTPPCTININWLLSTDVLTVTQKEMEFFRGVELARGYKSNFRPTQPLNGRKIFYIPVY